jgi:hypothetical protein
MTVIIKTKEEFKAKNIQNMVEAGETEERARELVEMGWCMPLGETLHKDVFPELFAALQPFKLPWYKRVFRRKFKLPNAEDYKC